MSDTRRDILDNLKALSFEQRLHFFELLAHNLTIAARSVWIENNLTDEEKIEALRKFNECLHRATARIWCHRLNTHVWTDEDFIGMLLGAEGDLPGALRGEISAALRHAYRSVAA